MDRFELDGKVYVAKDDDPNSFCNGCAGDGVMSLCAKLPECYHTRRDDARDIIWVEEVSDG